MPQVQASFQAKSAGSWQLDDHRLELSLQYFHGVLTPQQSKSKGRKRSALGKCQTYMPEDTHGQHMRSCLNNGSSSVKGYRNKFLKARKFLYMSFFASTRQLPWNSPPERLSAFLGPLDPAPVCSACDLDINTQNANTTFKPH